ncbi:auxin efflux carrier component 3-like isoform X1 [Henckelia pumila]|uniref:auxin efflux carrier component 3-like isoform X1 n=1 Tax=Henckelia pumila TaxID=405737 RepID=UPI003C6E23B6
MGKTHQSQLQQQGNIPGHDAKELHMFVWSSSASPVSEGRGAGGLHVFGGQDFGASEKSGRSEHGAKEIKLLVSDNPQNGETKGVPPTGHFGGEDFSFNGGGRDNDDREKDVPQGFRNSGEAPPPSSTREPPEA